jgi:hypothetical protein
MGIPVGRRPASSAALSTFPVREPGMGGGGLQPLPRPPPDRPLEGEEF